MDTVCTRKHIILLEKGNREKHKQRKMSVVRGFVSLDGPVDLVLPVKLVSNFICGQNTDITDLALRRDCGERYKWLLGDISSKRLTKYSVQNTPHVAWKGTRYLCTSKVSI